MWGSMHLPPLILGILIHYLLQQPLNLVEHFGIVHAVCQGFRSVI